MSSEEAMKSSEVEVQNEWNTVKRRGQRSNRRASNVGSAPTSEKPSGTDASQSDFDSKRSTALARPLPLPLPRPLARPRPAEREQKGEQKGEQGTTQTRERLPEAFIQKLQKAHQQAFRELCLSQRTVDDYVEDRMHLIDERTGRPSTNLRLSFSTIRDLTNPEFMKAYEAQKIMETRDNQKRPSRRQGERDRVYPGRTPKEDELEIEEEKFNRSRIYGKPRFREEIQEYYAKMGYQASYSFYENKERKRIYNMYIAW